MMLEKLVTYEMILSVEDKLKSMWTDVRWQKELEGIQLANIIQQVNNQFDDFKIQL